LGTRQAALSFTETSDPAIQPVQFAVNLTGNGVATQLVALQLQVSPAAAGTVSATPPSVTGAYALGTRVCLSAAAAAGWRFALWSGSVLDYSACLVMDSDKAVTATFTLAGAAPTIQLTSLSSFGTYPGFVAGVAHGVNPSDYRIASFVFLTGEGWYSKPYCAPTTVGLGSDGSFSTVFTTGGVDQLATKIALLLVPATLNVPCFMSTAGIPQDISQQSVAQLVVNRPNPAEREILFAGQPWGVKASTVRVGPGACIFSDSADSVAVDTQGSLHLRITNTAGNWSCAEIYSRAAVGFGVYRWTIAAMPNLDPSSVFGSFTWADAQSEPRELDFEAGFNTGDGTNAQFVVQPYSQAGNLQRIALPVSGPITIKMIWMPAQVSFQAFAGPDEGGAVVAEWNYTGIAPPADQPYENFRFNLWLNGGPPSSGNTQEIVVNNFQYQPFFPDSTAPLLTGVLNGASSAPGVAPGAVASLQGQNVANTSLTAGSPPLPTNLADVTVYVNGIPAPLFSVTPTMVIAQIPYESPLGPSLVSATVNGRGSQFRPFNNLSASPGLFVDSTGNCTAQNQDLTPNGPSNPAPAGTTVTAQLTGFGFVDNPVSSGAGAPSSPPSHPILPGTAQIDGQSVTLGLLDLAPGLVGIGQASVQIPAGATTGTHSLMVGVGGTPSNSCLISVSTGSPAPPPPPVLSTPANGTTGVSTNPTLAWAASASATSYQVFLGTTPNPPSVADTTSTSFAPGTLAPSTTYYWQVAAKNAAGSTNSPVWSFTTVGGGGGGGGTIPLDPCVNYLTPKTLTIPGAGGSVSFSVITYGACAWRITGLPDWITVPTGTSGLGTVTVTLSLGANQGDARSVVLSVVDSVTAKSLEVNQAKWCSCSLSPGGQGIPAAGGSGTLNITAAPDCLWAVSAPPSWVTFSGEATGLGNGTVPFLAAGNAGAHRSGIVFAGGTAFMFDQLSAAPTTAGNLAHFAQGAGWETTVTLVNTGYALADVQLSFFGDNGNAINGSGSTSGLQVKGGGVLKVSAPADPATSGMSTTGWVGLATDGGVQGYGTFRLVKASQEAVVPLETRHSAAYYLPFDNTGGYVYGVALSNISNLGSNIDVVVRDTTSGKPFVHGTIALDQHSHIAFVLTDKFPLLANTRGTIEFSTMFPGQITVLGLRFNTARAFTTVPALVAGTASGSKDLTSVGSLPHFASGGGWKTIYTLANTGATAAEARLSFFDDTGKSVALGLTLPQTSSSAIQATSAFDQTLDPGTMLLLETISTSATSETGWAELETNGSVSAFAVFQYQSLSGDQQEAVVPLESRNATSYMLPFNNTNGYSDGIALANLSTSPVTVAATLRDAETGDTILSGTLELPAHGHTSFMLTDRFPLAAGIAGTLELSAPSSGTISVLGLHVNASNAFTTTPALVRW